MNKHKDFARLERDWGIHSLAMDYMPDEFRRSYTLAMDAQPTLVGTASGGIPAMFTSYVDPEVIRILQAPNEGANILGEKKNGDFETKTAFFPVVENVGEVAAYGDRNTNGKSNANATWPQRQSFLFQTIIEYGDLEMRQAGEAKLNWVAEQQTSGAATLDKFMDYCYHFGVTGLQNYGLLNDPSLSAALTPTTKTAGGTYWVTSAGVQNAQAAEMFADVQMLANSLFITSKGRIKASDDFVLAMAPGSEGGLLATNSFGISVLDLLKKNFPKLVVKTSARYATAAGNVVQLIATKFGGKDTGYCAFNVKQFDHPVVRELSSFKQKKTAGTWGAVLRYPVAIAQLIGV